MAAIFGIAVAGAATVAIIVIAVALNNYLKALDPDYQDDEDV